MSAPTLFSAGDDSIRHNEATGEWCYKGTAYGDYFDAYAVRKKDRAAMKEEWEKRREDV